MGRTAALIKREIRETYWKRKTGLIIQVALAVILVPTAMYPVFRILGRSDSSGARDSLLLGIFPVFIVVSLGVPFLIEHFYKDKMRRNIEVLLALGFSPTEIWAGKVIATGAFSFGSYLLGMTLALVWLQSRGGTVSSLAPWGLVNLLVLSPLLAIAILGAKGILHLLLSDIRLLNIAFILPFALLFIFMRSALGFLGVAAIDDADVSVALFAGSLCFLGVSLLALKTLPKERLL